MFVLDTNVVSELRKAAAGRADENVVAWARGIPASLMYISAITLFELEVGVQLAERRDPPRGALLRRWLDADVSVTFGERLLPVTPEIARRAAGAHVPDPAPVLDSLIGATAVEHRMAVVSRDTVGFSRFHDLELVNPWVGD